MSDLDISAYIGISIRNTRVLGKSKNNGIQLKSDRGIFVSNWKYIILHRISALPARDKTLNSLVQKNY